MTAHKIAQYAADDPAVWPLIGPLLTSRAVAKELGGQPFADGAVAWWVATVRGKVVGIACLKDVAGAYWEDCAYVVPECRGKGIHLSLAAARTRHVATLPPKPLKVCVRRKRWDSHYVSRGFQATSERGDWVYGIKPVKTEQEQTK